MAITRARANKQMEDEIVILNTKLEDLDQIFLDLHLQHSAMSD